MKGFNNLVAKLNKNSCQSLATKCFQWTIILSVIVLILSTISSIFNLGLLGFYFENAIYGDYGDFFDVLRFIETRNPYEYAPTLGHVANYPPLAYLILYPFMLLTKLGGQEISTLNAMGCVSMGIFVLLTFVPVFIAVYRLLPFQKDSKWFAVGALAISYITYFEFTRLNVNILALDFIVLFFIFYKSDKKWLRILSAFFLACSGAIKLYPFFLAVLFLKDKRFLEFVLSGVFLVALIILPFFFFVNGIKNLNLMIGQMTSFVDSHQANLFNKNDVAFMKLARSFYALIGFNTFDATAIKVFQIIKYAFFLFSCFALIFTKNNFKFMLFATLIYINFTDNNYTYALIFMLLPLLEFFNEKKDFLDKEDKTITPEACFYLLTAFVMLSYFYDLIIVVPILLIIVLLINVKNNFHKKLSIGFIVFLGVLVALQLLNVILYLALNRPLQPFMEFITQPTMAVAPFILQVILIVEGFTSFRKKLREKTNG